MDGTRMIGARLFFIINGDWEYEDDITFYETPKFGDQLLVEDTWFIIKNVEKADDGIYNVYLD